MLVKLPCRDLISSLSELTAHDSAPIPTTKGCILRIKFNLHNWRFYSLRCTITDCPVLLGSFPNIFLNLYFRARQADRDRERETDFIGRSTLAPPEGPQLAAAEFTTLISVRLWKWFHPQLLCYLLDNVSFSELLHQFRMLLNAVATVCYIQLF